MQKLIKGSFFFTLISETFSLFRSQWRKSRVVGRFLSDGKGEAASKSSIFTRGWLRFHQGLNSVFDKLRLNKLLRNSIFAMPFIWGFATVTLAPILPTMAVLALVLANGISLLLAFGCDRERKLRYSPANKYILLYAFVYIAATFTSVTIVGSLFSGALTTLFVLFAFVIQNSVTTRRSLDTLIYAFVISGALVSAYGVFQYVFGSTFGATAWLDSEMFEGIGVRVYSTLGNPNVLAKYLLLVTPFAGACIFIVKGILPKLFFTGCFGAMLLCMLLTFSRGGWLGLIVAAAIFLVMLDRRFILVGIIGIVILYFALPDVILDRFLSIGNLGDTSTSYRVSIWLGTINMLRDFWFTGIGPGTAAFNTIYPLYSFNTIISPHSHNLYLQIMSDAGIAGILVFLTIIFTYFRNLCRAMSRENNKSSKILQIAAISGVFGFLVQGMTDYSFYNYRVTLVFWAVIGLGALAARRSALTHNE
ncbi:MAG: O-antigen ligase family protein [Oscillospiraceae bacterium]|nr:O-antigen ligase family protein [Oscillospiraceae bacterium]